MELLTTERFGSVFGFRVRDGLPLQIVRPIDPAAFQGENVIDAVADAMWSLLSGARTGMQLSKFTPNRRAALDSPLRISWTRNTPSPGERWNG